MLFLWIYNISSLILYVHGDNSRYTREDLIYIIMIHFIFTEKEPRYLFLKVDNKNDITVMNRLKDHLNLTDPICYLPTYSGPPFTQDFLWDYVKPTGERVWYCSIGLWKVIYDFFNENKIEYDGLKENQHMFKRPIKHSFEEFKEIVDSWGFEHFNKTCDPAQL